MASKAAQTSDSAQNARTDPNLAGAGATLPVGRIVPGPRTGVAGIPVGAEGDCTSNQLYPGSPIPKHAD
jgi:hypothetical protein